MIKHLAWLWVGTLLGLCMASSSVCAQDFWPTIKDPFKIDTKERSLSIIAEVNKKYLSQTTHHGIVSTTGKLVNKSLFRAFVDPKILHEGFIGLGLKPGNNMTMKNKEKAFVEGEPLDLFVTWKSARKMYRFGEVVSDSNGKPIDIRFGGNLAKALEMNTGCLLCLDSCPVGITSNGAYTYGAIENRKEVNFAWNKNVSVPEDMLVVITFKARR
jgi:hypothetical protein